MTVWTEAEIIDAIANTLSAATGLTYPQSYNELKDGMQDMPTLQVYWDDTGQDLTGNVDRSSFGAGVRQSAVTIIADLYARQRAHLDEDMAALMPLVTAIRVVLEEQKTKPYFGLDAIKGFQWTARRVIFEYGDAAVKYMGARFTITVRVF